MRIWSYPKAAMNLARAFDQGLGARNWGKPEGLLCFWDLARVPRRHTQVDEVRVPHRVMAAKWHRDHDRCWQTLLVSFCFWSMISAIVSLFIFIFDGERLVMMILEKKEYGGWPKKAWRGEGKNTINNNRWERWRDLFFVKFKITSYLLPVVQKWSYSHWSWSKNGKIL